MIWVIVGWAFLAPLLALFVVGMILSDRWLK